MPPVRKARIEIQGDARSFLSAIRQSEAAVRAFQKSVKGAGLMATQTPVVPKDTEKQLAAAARGHQQIGKVAQTAAKQAAAGQQKTIAATKTSVQQLTGAMDQFVAHTEKGKRYLADTEAAARKIGGSAAQIYPLTNAVKGLVLESKEGGREILENTAKNRKLANEMVARTGARYRELSVSTERALATQRTLTTATMPGIVAYKNLSDTLLEVERDMKRVPPKEHRANMGRDIRGALAGAGAFTSLGRSIAYASAQFLAFAVISGVLRSAISAAADFEKILSRVVGLAGGAREQVEQFGKALLRLGPQVGVGPRELANALYFTASAGIEASKQMEVVSNSAKASAAGLGDVQTVADAVTSAMNAYGAANLSAAEATDILVSTVRFGKGEAAAFAPVIGVVASFAATLGVRLNEVGAALAVMTRLGTPAYTAAINLQALFSNLIHPTRQANAALREFGEQAGVTGLTFASLVDQMRTKGLLSVLQTLRDVLGDNANKIGQVFTNVRALRGVLAIVGKNAQDAYTVFRQMAGQTNALRVAFGAVSKDPAFRFEAFKAAVESFQIALGAALLPTVVKIGDALGAWLSKEGNIERLNKTIQGMVEAATDFFHALRALLGPLAALVTIASKLTGGWSNFFKIMLFGWAATRIKSRMFTKEVTVEQKQAALASAKAWLQSFKEREAGAGRLAFAQRRAALQAERQIRRETTRITVRQRTGEMFRPDRTPIRRDQIFQPAPGKFTMQGAGGRIERIVFVRERAEFAKAAVRAINETARNIAQASGRSSSSIAQVSRRFALRMGADLAGDMNLIRGRLSEGARTLFAGLNQASMRMQQRVGARMPMVGRLLDSLFGKPEDAAARLKVIGSRFGEEISTAGNNLVRQGRLTLRKVFGDLNRASMEAQRSLRDTRPRLSRLIDTLFGTPVRARGPGGRVVQDLTRERLLSFRQLAANMQQTLAQTRGRISGSIRGFFAGLNQDTMRAQQRLGVRVPAIGRIIDSLFGTPTNVAERLTRVGAQYSEQISVAGNKLVRQGRASLTRFFRELNQTSMQAQQRLSRGRPLVGSLVNALFGTPTRQRDLLGASTTRLARESRLSFNRFAAQLRRSFSELNQSTMQAQRRLGQNFPLIGKAMDSLFGKVRQARDPFGAFTTGLQRQGGLWRDLGNIVRNQTAVVRAALTMMAQDVRVRAAAIGEALTKFEQAMKRAGTAARTQAGSFAALFAPIRELFRPGKMEYKPTFQPGPIRQAASDIRKTMGAAAAGMAAQFKVAFATMATGASYVGRVMLLKIGTALVVIKALMIEAFAAVGFGLLIVALTEVLFHLKDIAKFLGLWPHAANSTKRFEDALKGVNASLERTNKLMSDLRDKTAQVPSAQEGVRTAQAAVNEARARVTTEPNARRSGAVVALSRAQQQLADAETNLARVEYGARKIQEQLDIEENKRRQGAGEMTRKIIEQRDQLVRSFPAWKVFHSVGEDAVKNVTTASDMLLDKFIELSQQGPKLQRTINGALAAIQAQTTKVLPDSVITRVIKLALDGQSVNNIVRQITKIEKSTEQIRLRGLEKVPNAVARLSPMLRSTLPFGPGTADQFAIPERAVAPGTRGPLGAGELQLAQAAVSGSKQRMVTATRAVIAWIKEIIHSADLTTRQEIQANVELKNYKDQLKGLLKEQAETFEIRGMLRLGEAKAALSGSSAAVLQSAVAIRDWISTQIKAASSAKGAAKKGTEWLISAIQALDQYNETIVAAAQTIPASLDLQQAKAAGGTIAQKIQAARATIAYWASQVNKLLSGGIPELKGDERTRALAEAYRNLNDARSDLKDLVQKTVGAFTIPRGLQLAEAKASAGTEKMQRDINQRVVAWIRRQIREGKFHGDALIQAWTELGSRVTKAIDNQKDLLKQAIDTVTGELDSARSSIGELFQGPVLNPSELQNKMTLGLTGPTAGVLTKDLDAQVKQYTEFQNALTKLGKRGAPKQLIAELSKLGVGALPQVRALLEAKPDALQKFFQAFVAREALVKKTALVQLRSDKVELAARQIVLGLTPAQLKKFVETGVFPAAPKAQARATGGVISGSGNRDTVPAMLTPGEVVFNKRQQQKLASRLGVTGGPHDLFTHVDNMPHAQQFDLGGIVKALTSPIRAIGRIEKFNNLYNAAHRNLFKLLPRRENSSGRVNRMAAFVARRGFRTEEGLEYAYGGGPNRLYAKLRGRSGTLSIRSIGQGEHTKVMVGGPWRRHMMGGGMMPMGGHVPQNFQQGGVVATPRQLRQAGAARFRDLQKNEQRKRIEFALAAGRINLQRAKAAWNFYGLTTPPDPGWYTPHRAGPAVTPSVRHQEIPITPRDILNFNLRGATRGQRKDVFDWYRHHGGGQFKRWMTAIEWGSMAIPGPKGARGTGETLALTRTLRAGQEIRIGRKWFTVKQAEPIFERNPRGVTEFGSPRIAERVFTGMQITPLRGEPFLIPAAKVHTVVRATGRTVGGLAPRPRRPAESARAARTRRETLRGSPLRLLRQQEPARRPNTPAEREGKWTLINRVGPGQEVFWPNRWHVVKQAVGVKEGVRVTPETGKPFTIPRSERFVRTRHFEPDPGGTPARPFHRQFAELVKAGETVFWQGKWRRVAKKAAAKGGVRLFGAQGDSFVIPKGTSVKIAGAIRGARARSPRFGARSRTPKPIQTEASLQNQIDFWTDQYNNKVAVVLARSRFPSGKPRPGQARRLRRALIAERKVLQKISNLLGEREALRAGAAETRMKRETITKVGGIKATVAMLDDKLMGLRRIGFLVGSRDWGKAVKRTIRRPSGRDDVVYDFVQSFRAANFRARIANLQRQYGFTGPSASARHAVDFSTLRDRMSQRKALETVEHNLQIWSGQRDAFLKRSLDNLSPGELNKLKALYKQAGEEFPQPIGTGYQLRKQIPQGEGPAGLTRTKTSAKGLAKVKGTAAPRGPEWRKGADGTDRYLWWQYMKPGDRVVSWGKANPRGPGPEGILRHGTVARVVGDVRPDAMMIHWDGTKSPVRNSDPARSIRPEGGPYVREIQPTAPESIVEKTIAQNLIAGDMLWWRALKGAKFEYAKVVDAVADKRGMKVWLAGNRPPFYLPEGAKIQVQRAATERGRKVRGMRYAVHVEPGWDILHQFTKQTPRGEQTFEKWLRVVGSTETRKGMVIKTSDKDFGQITVPIEKKFKVRFQQGGVVGLPRKFDIGGIVPGRGIGDTVPAMLTPGEIVFNKGHQKKLARKLGVPNTPGAVFTHVHRMPQGLATGGVGGGGKLVSADSAGELATSTSEAIKANRVVVSAQSANLSNVVFNPEINVYLDGERITAKVETRLGRKGRSTAGQRRGGREGKGAVLN